MRPLHPHQVEPSTTSGQVLRTVNGETTWADPPAAVPLTTEIGGVPDLVWDSDNQLVFTQETP